MPELGQRRDYDIASYRGNVYILKTTDSKPTTRRTWFERPSLWQRIKAKLTPKEDSIE